MENKIKELKELALAHELALTYDYVPYESQLDEIITDDLVDFKITKNELGNLLNTYQGEDCGSLEAKVMHRIRKL